MAPAFGEPTQEDCCEMMMVMMMVATTTLSAGHWQMERVEL
jgi:hypothetical protein